MSCEHHTRHYLSFKTWWLREVVCPILTVISKPWAHLKKKHQIPRQGSHLFDESTVTSQMISEQLLTSLVGLQISPLIKTGPIFKYLSTQSKVSQFWHYIHEITNVLFCQQTIQSVACSRWCRASGWYWPCSWGTGGSLLLPSSVLFTLLVSLLLSLISTFCAVPKVRRLGDEYPVLVSMMSQNQPPTSIPAIRNPLTVMLNRILTRDTHSLHSSSLVSKASWYLGKRPLNWAFKKPDHKKMPN